MKTNKAKIYKVISQIPKGKVMTYGQVAKKVKLKSPRTVGLYIHTNKDPVTVPCHRVVFSDGSLSKGYGMGGIKKQKERLQQEGIFVHDYKVDLHKYGSNN